MERLHTLAPPMLIDQYLPSCEFTPAVAVEVDAQPETIWDALPEITHELAPKGVTAAMLRLAAVIRRDRAQPSREAGRRLVLVEGEAIGDLFDPYEDPRSFVIVRVAEPREVVLEGSHRYSRYFTNLYLEPLAGERTRVHNVTRATFSRSPIARIYFQGVRAFHSPVMRWWLSRLKRAIEARTSGQRAVPPGGPDTARG